MQKNRSFEALSSKEMQRLALIHVQAYLSACHCQSRPDVLNALKQWQSVGADLADVVRHTRIIIIH
ncbi:hypothetical protein [Pantoea eucalypti]|uniref:hypothetical protein n=1 Tax=Pantoea eucalypti TaxID=470933 RepID=UPI00289F2815|nr:hypothetical protein [Pantoea eucalypti]